MTLLYSDAAIAVHHADWRALRERVDVCHAVAVDAPYSERTHAGHDAKAGAYAPQGYEKTNGKSPNRRAISYASWDETEVAAFVEAWAPITIGWFATITDHTLAPAWAEALERAGRYVFAPLAFVAPGSRVRLSGDGPSNWTTWIVVARPRTHYFAGWGTLPGAYVLPPGANDSHASADPSQYVTGGKPLWLMRALIRDYTRPGDLVVDPCCGAGTTLLAARLEGRRAIGGDALEAHALLAAERLRPLPTVARRGTLALDFAGGSSR